MKRRHFLQHLTSTLATTTFINGFGAEAIWANEPFIQQLALAAEKNDRILVIIQLSGGNDGLNTVIPLDQMSTYTDVNYRGNIAIKENKVLGLGTNKATGLHPSLGGLQSLYNEGKLSIVQGVSYPTPNFSHFEANDIWMKAADLSKQQTSGWGARYLTTEFPNYPTGYPNTEMPDPVAIQIGALASSTLISKGQPIATILQDPDAFARLVGEKTTTPSGNVKKEAQEHLTYIQELQNKSVEYAAQIKVAADKGKNQVAYPTNNLAAQLQIIARLIHGGLKTKIYYVSTGGFDTHASQVVSSDTSTGTHANLLKNLSDSIKVFTDDLSKMGVAERVVGMTFSEFGRRAKSNASLGTDHGTSAPMFVFGAGIKTSMIGKNPNLLDLENNNLKMQHDFRQVYAAILADWLMIPNPNTVLLGTYTPVPIFRTSNTARQGVEERIVVQHSEMDLQTFPNPTNDYLTIKLEEPNDEIKQGFLVHTNGYQSELKLNRINNESWEIDVKSVQTGDYQLRIITNNGKVLGKKLIIKR